MSDTTHPTSAQADGPWTEEEVTAFSQALAAFQESLPPRQRAAFAAILETAAGATADQDVQGYFFHQFSQLLPPQNLTYVDPNANPQIAVQNPYSTSPAPGTNPLGSGSQKGNVGNKI